VLTGLTMEERREYIEQKVKLAGGTLSRVFTAGAMKLLCESLRWPMDINETCTRVLSQAAEFGEVPVTADLVKKHVQGSASLGALLLMAGMTPAELRSRLEDEYGLKDVSRECIKRMLAGSNPKDTRILEAAREILLPTVGEAAAEAIAERMPPVQRARWEKVRLLLNEYHMDYDYLALCEQAGLALPRFWQVVMGTPDMTDSELRAVEVAVRHAHKAKQTVAERQAKVA
jgi:hypothetical protein